MKFTKEERDVIEAFQNAGYEATKKGKPKNLSEENWKVRVEVLSYLDENLPDENETLEEAVARLVNEGKGKSFVVRYATRIFYKSGSVDNFQRRVRRLWEKCKDQKDQNSVEKPSLKSKVRRNSDGTIDLDFEATLPKGEMTSPEDVLRLKDLSPDDWTVVDMTINTYQSQTKGGGKLNLYQIKVRVRPKSHEDFGIEDVKRMYEYALASKKPKTMVKAFPYNENLEHLEIDVADLHMGLLSWHQETGSSFDLEICKEYFLSSIADIVRRCRGRRFKSIKFCTLGDILHIDNDENKTTKGTLQQADGRFAKIYRFALNTMIEAIETLFKLKAPIEYYYTCGNHDRNFGYTLVTALELKYSDNPNIKFETSPNPMKAFTIGEKILVGLMHGDVSKKVESTWLTRDYRRQFGAAQWAEIHCGHIHTEECRMAKGTEIPIRAMMAQCGNSYWEHQQGYRSDRGLMCFVWNENTGLRETWYDYFPAFPK